MNAKEFNTFKKKPVKFKVENNHFFRRNSRSMPIRQVFDDPKEQQIIFQQFHDKRGNKAREKIYQQVVSRYWWDNL